MDRPSAGFQLRWLMLPAAWVLLVSALSLPRHAYTGLALRPDGRGGWVWSERRDRLTRTFYLLCLAFAVWLAPSPSLASGFARGAYEQSFVLAQFFIGPLFSHFFALFPESGRPRARAWVLVGYAMATVLLACFLGVRLEAAFGAGDARVLLPLLTAANGVVIVAGLLGGLVLFALAFLRVENADARRRLRVAFFGTLLGALPFALLVALHSLSRA